MFKDLKITCIKAEGQGLLDLLQDWHCPDPLAKVIFRIEEIKS